MDRNELLDELHRSRLVAVIRSKTADEALTTAAAAGDAGVKFVEITFSVPGAPKVIEALARRPELHVGAGTVLSREQAQAAITAGAEFVVAPSLELDLVPVCHAAGIAFFPGAATPTEIITAARAGADLVKIFPADCLGGAYFIRQMSGPFPEIRFMVSGGVSLNNVKDYVEAGVMGICLGSAYLSNLFAHQGRAGFIQEVACFTRSISEAQS
jgi:2-dehydro-3-deoxyphosphogluconate aldolase/(4S)-4-hydroxy-2-oxoglutarate aldolase